ncbi:MAG: class I SAM-dependent methyltransferase [Cyclobacteriaceae bacterium]|nr:class I SAM-dependent methyltransferase [Cyclobacteriaceae bacterium]
MTSADQARTIAQSPDYIRHNYFHPKSKPLLYLRFRALRPILKLYQKHLLRKWKGAPIPWMTPAAIDILHTLLKPDMKGFEFGSGRSTLFIAPRVKELVSLEHDQQWFTQIEVELKNKKLNHVYYVKILPANDPSKTISYPKNNYENYRMEATPASCFTEYYSFIDQYPDDYFDFVIVDGRARVECALHALPKLKQGGILILDNAERLRYRSIHENLAGWEKVFTTSGITDTVFWFKP